MPEGNLAVALISDVFFSDDGLERLMQRLGEAKELGAELALLPELPWLSTRRGWRWACRSARTPTGRKARTCSARWAPRSSSARAPRCGIPSRAGRRC